MDEDLTRVIKTTVVPIVGVFLLLFLFSRGCAHKSSDTSATPGITETTVTMPVTARTTTGSGSLWPDGFTEEMARYYIENDARVHQPLTQRVSKSVPSSMLTTLVGSGYVRMEPDGSGNQVGSLTPSAGSLGPIHDYGDAWELTLATRRFLGIVRPTAPPADPGTFQLAFTCNSDRTAAGKLAGAADGTITGHATFVQSDGKWTLSDLTL